MLRIDFWNIAGIIVNLLILYWVFKKFLYQPVMNVINQREEMIKNQFKEASDSMEEADKLKAEYASRIDSAKQEADEIIISARARAEDEHARTIEKTQAETEKMIEKAKQDIENEKVKATQAAQADIAGLALMAARKIIETGDTHDTAEHK